MKEIVFYKLPSGKCPVEDFLDSLSAKEAQKVPKQEIKLAEQRKLDYLQRRDDNE